MWIALWWTGENVKISAINNKLILENIINF